MVAVQVVDVQKAREFLERAVEAVPDAEWRAVAAALDAKAARLQARLAPAALAGAGASADDLRGVLGEVFAARRRAGAILAAAGNELRPALAELLYGTGEPAERLEPFINRMSGTAGEAVPAAVWGDLAGECLHYTAPAERWLWTRWVWDPAGDSGALPMVLVTLGEGRGGPAGPAAVYRQAGEAVAYLASAADTIGLSAFGPLPLAMDVFLAGVYAQYLYMVTSVRTTDEFAGILPRLPEMVRRLLGIWRAGNRSEEVGLT